MSSDKSNSAAMFFPNPDRYIYIYILFSFSFVLIHYVFTIIAEILGTSTYGMVRP